MRAGLRQVVYAGHPLYLHNADPSGGTIYGEGVEAFGSVWTLIAPSGDPIQNLASAQRSVVAHGGCETERYAHEVKRCRQHTCAIRAGCAYA